MDNLGISVTNEQLNPLIPISDPLILSSFNSIGTKLDPTITLPLLAPPTFSESPLKVGGISHDSLLLGVSNTSLLKSAGSASDLFPTAPIPEGMGIVQRSSNVATLESPIGETTIDLAAAPQLANSTTTSTQQLTSEILADLKSAAIARWASLGLSTAEVEKLQGTKLVVDNLASNTLAETQGYTIILDWDASGIGWYVDATPLDNEEFTRQVSATELVADGDSVAFRRVDLLSTLTHEFGHILGLEHSQTDALMRKSLPIGERLLPSLETLRGIRKDGVVSDRADLTGVDLIVTDFSSSVNTVTLGGELSVSWTVKNQGSSDALNNWNDQIYLSDDNVFDSNDVILATIANLSTLATNNSYTTSGNITLPTQAIGNKYLIIRTNSDDNQIESDNTNNYTFTPITIQTPDLQADRVIAVDSSGNSLSSIDFGQQFNINWDVSQIGLANISTGTWQDRLYLSRDKILSVDDINIASQNQSRILLSNGQYSDTTSVNILYNNSLPVDSNGFVSELGTNNSIATALDLQQNFVQTTGLNNYEVKAKGTIISNFSINAGSQK